MPVFYQNFSKKELFKGIKALHKPFFAPKEEIFYKFFLFQKLANRKKFFSGLKAHPERIYMLKEN